MTLTIGQQKKKNVAKIVAIHIQLLVDQKDKWAKEHFSVF